MNLIEIFLGEVSPDKAENDSRSEYLKEYYDGASQFQQAAINETFINLCGHSYETLLEMETEKPEVP